MPLHDFNCKTCERVFESGSFWNPNIGCVEPQECPACGTLSEMVWLKAPAMEGEENIPAEERRAARMQLGVNVQTRSELKRELERQGKVAVTADEFNRGKSSVNTHSPVLTPEKRRRMAELVKEKKEMAIAGKLRAPELSADVKSELGEVAVGR